MKNLLIKYDSNYADEFDLEGFVVMTEDKWNQHKVLAEKVFQKLETLPKDQYGRYKKEYGGIARGVELYFGTNEYQEYESLKSYLQDFSVTELSDEDMIFLKKFFSHGDEIKNGTVVMIDEYQLEDE